MPAPRKAPQARQSSNITVAFTAAELEAYDAYCDALEKSRGLVLRTLLRRIKLDTASPAARRFRELQAALPPLEAP